MFFLELKKVGTLVTLLDKTFLVRCPTTTEHKTTEKTEQNQHTNFPSSFYTHHQNGVVVVHDDDKEALVAIIIIVVIIIILTRTTTTRTRTSVLSKNK